ncbi:MAG: hypothetical protein ACK5X3_04020 [Pseudomonadota bacterium]
MPGGSELANGTPGVRATARYVKLAQPTSPAAPARNGRAQSPAGPVSWSCAKRLALMAVERRSAPTGAGLGSARAVTA